MIIDKNISDYIVFVEDSLASALHKIEKNKHRFILAVSQFGVLEGIMTDGDFRRWALSQDRVNLDESVERAINRSLVTSSVSDSTDSIKKRLKKGVGDSPDIDIIPLVDSHNHLVAIARKREHELSIGDFRISDESPTFIIAEIGNNHNGSIDVARRLVDKAIEAGADCVKFQLRDMDSLYMNKGQPDDASADLGAQYTLDLLARFQLSKDEMSQAFDYCRQQRALALCTPFDIPSLQFLQEYGLPAFKLASADLTNHDLLEFMAKQGNPLICSTGMSTEGEIISAVELLKLHGAQYVLMLCNSTYPAPFRDVNLRYMSRLSEIGDCFVGYSGHERGISVPVAAVSLGAKIVEKHFTLDRTLEGNDHRVSLLPDEFKQMVGAIREVEQALGDCEKREITQGEMMNREVLGKSLIINCDLAKGQVLTEQIIEVKSPGNGLSPYFKSKLIGKKACRNFKRGDFFFLSDIEENGVTAKNYTFRRPFGIPVRYHDVHKMLGFSNLDLVEFHLSYKDMEIDPNEVFDQPLDIDFIVHSPELFAGDHILDLCSFDEEYRQHSINELQRVIDITRSLKQYFPKTERPPIVVNVGGTTQDAHLAVEERIKYYELLVKSIAKLDSFGVGLIPQSMPPFPWHFGGQRYQNLFIDPEETALFCSANNMRICLDISHAKLACNYFKWSLSKYVETVGPYTAHLHIVDAEGIDSEGLQINEGEIDFYALVKNLDLFAPSASFIPEIWQGHKNDGEGFWVALERLEKWFYSENFIGFGR